MSELVAGFDAGRKICKILGLDPKHVKSLEIHFRADVCVTAVVEKFVTLEQVTMLGDEME